MTKLNIKIFLLTASAVVITLAGVLFVAVNGIVEDKKNYLFELSVIQTPQSAAQLENNLNALAESFEVAKDTIPKEIINIYLLDEKNKLKSVLYKEKSNQPDFAEFLPLLVKNKILFKQNDSSSFFFLKMIGKDKLIYEIENQFILSAVEFSPIKSWAIYDVNQPKKPVFIFKGNSDSFWSQISSSQFSTNTIGFEQVDPSGQRWVVASTPLKISNHLVLMSRVSVLEASYLVKDLLKKLAPFIGLLFVLTLVASFAFSNLITRYLAYLVALTEKISRGEFNFNLEKKSNDELYLVAKSLKKMSLELSDRESKIKTQAIEITKAENRAELGNWVASIAHEIKNPLSSVLTYAQIFEKKSGQSEITSAIIQESKRANRIILELLSFARQREPNKKNLNLRTFLNDSYLLLKPLVEKEGIQLKLILSDIKQENLNFDSEQIYQVILNIVMNAVHALIESKTNSPCIELLLGEKNSESFIAVKDNGPGIPAEIQNQIFKPFFSTKKDKQGTGLGLSVCKTVVEQHHGVIQVVSSPEYGTEFQLRFPDA